MESSSRLGEEGGMVCSCRLEGGMESTHSLGGGGGGGEGCMEGTCKLLEGRWGEHGVYVQAILGVAIVACIVLHRTALYCIVLHPPVSPATNRYNVAPLQAASRSLTSP